MAELDDDRLVAGIALLQRTGAHSVSLRHDEPENPKDPVVWMAVIEWNVVPLGQGYGKPVPEKEEPGERGYEVAAALDPVNAVMRLCNQVLDGSAKCVHCQRPAMFDEDFGKAPLDKLLCWYQWDPETKTFRRSCENDPGPFQNVNRNDPCPCGSGLKFKKCHGG